MANFLKSLFVKGVEIDTASASAGKVLTYDGTKFAPATPGSGSLALDDLSDVVVTTPATTQYVRYNGTDWVNATISAGDVPTLNQNTTGSAATATNVAYSGLTGTVPTWNQNTTGSAATWTTARTITLGGDLTGNVSIDGSANATLTATIAANSVALGTDTTGNYMSGVTAGTGISVTHTPSEGSSATVALAASYGDTQNPYASKTANYVLAAPNGSSGVPTFRAIVAADIPTLNQNTTGTAATVTGAAQPAITSVGTLGSLAVSGTINTSNGVLELGLGRVSNGFAYVDLIGDTTYTDYGLRLLRGNTGANANSHLVHRGTGTFSLITQDAGTITFNTTNTERMRIGSNGNVGIGTGSPTTALDVVGTTTLKTVKAGSGAVAISSTSYVSAYAVSTYNTSTPHGFATGDTVAVTGITPSSWNRTATITVASATSFYFSLFNGSTGGAYSSGGTASGPPSTLYVDTTNDRVGIGTSSPSEKLDVAGNIALTGSVVFEGATADGFETTLSVTDPTADRTITLPDASGTVATTTNVRDTMMKFIMEVM